MEQETLSYLRDFAAGCKDEALDLLCALARIPAPSHHEEKRSAFIYDWMYDNGLKGAYVDEAKNVICALNDDGKRDLIVFAAHMDVVFPDTTELPLHIKDDRVFAPGVGDDTANLVVMLLAARHLAQHPELIPEDKGILVVANSCEEGLGNLEGTTQLFASYGDRIERFYSFDLNIPGFSSVAVGSHRWKISVTTLGGHSYANFGRANAIERLCALVTDLYKIELPTTARTTINVGSIEGGTTVNTIAANASCLFEYRSSSDAVLQDVRAQFEHIVESYRNEKVAIDVEEVGIRPASSDGRSEALDRISAITADIISAATGKEAIDMPLSTDANVPLSMGVPANTIGATYGALMHTREEWIDISSIEDGLRIALGVMLAQKYL